MLNISHAQILNYSIKKAKFMQAVLELKDPLFLVFLGYLLYNFFLGEEKDLPLIALTLEIHVPMRILGS